MSPTEFDWILKDVWDRMNWFAGEQMPDDIGSAIDYSTGDVDSSKDIWASTRENLSSGFPIRSYQNQPAALQRLAKIVKFRL